MQDSNYVILVDENGQPYIAHSIFGRLKSGAGKATSAVKTASGKVSSGVGRGVRTAHKYLLKVGEGAKARYAYTKEEVDALMGRGRQAVGEAAEKSRTVASAVTKRGRAALSAAGTKARAALDQGKDRAGYDERDRRDQARERLGGKVDTSTPEGRQAWQDFEKAQAEYRQTPLGKLEYAKDRASEIMSETSRTAKEFGSDIKSRSERMREEFRDKASEPGDKVKEAADDLARDLIPGYAERSRWQKDEERASEAQRRFDAMQSEYAKAVNTVVDTENNRDTSAAAAKARDDAVSAIRKFINDGSLMQAQKDVWDANEATWESGRAYAKTPLGKVEEFMKDPLFNMQLAVEGVAWDIQDKIRDARQKIAERRQEKASAKAEAAMKKDPKVMRAREAYSTCQSEYNAAENRFMEYITSSRAEKGSDEWKLLEREFDRAKDNLDFAKDELERYEKPYRQ